MKIAWFTPLARKSAIARCSQIVVGALQGLADVEVFYFDSGEVLAVDARVRRFATHAQVDTGLLSRFDLVVYSFGNYLPFHQEVYEVSKRWPGVCILHDFVVQHFFAAYFIEKRGDSAAYVDLMEEWYGNAGRGVATESIYGAKIWDSDKVVDYPLFEELIRGAEGVVTHSEFFKQKVQERFAGPVRKIPLPLSIDRHSPVPSRESLGIGRDALLILTIGHVNPNKRIASVIEALGSLEPRERTYTYAIVGPCAAGERTTLEQLIRSNNLQERVRIIGEVSDEIMRAYLHHADLCVNLRYPTVEGASASAIEEMLFGKPIIVATTGFFAELPDECVVKVEPRSKGQLRQALELLLSPGGASERNRLARAAEHYAGQHFRADLYAQQILDFANEVRSSRPLLGVADKVGRELDQLGTPPKSSIVSGLGLELNDLFSRGGS